MILTPLSTATLASLLLFWSINPLRGRCPAFHKGAAWRIQFHRCQCRHLQASIGPNVRFAEMLQYGKSFFTTTILGAILGFIISAKNGCAWRRPVIASLRQSKPNLSHKLRGSSTKLSVPGFCVQTRFGPLRCNTTNHHNIDSGYCTSNTKANSFQPFQSPATDGPLQWRRTMWTAFVKIMMSTIRMPCSRKARRIFPNANLELAPFPEAAQQRNELMRQSRGIVVRRRRPFPFPPRSVVVVGVAAAAAAAAVAAATTAVAERHHVIVGEYICVITETRTTTTTIIAVRRTGGVWCGTNSETGSASHCNDDSHRYNVGSTGWERRCYNEYPPDHHHPDQKETKLPGHAGKGDECRGHQQCAKTRQGVTTIVFEEENSSEKEYQSRQRNRQQSSDDLKSTTNGRFPTIHLTLQQRRHCSSTRAAGWRVLVGRFTRSTRGRWSGADKVLYYES